MLEIFLTLTVALITLIIFVGTIYSVWIGLEQWQYMHDPHKMLFLSSTNNQINQKLGQIIFKYAPKTQDYNLVELGCGKAVILKSLAQKYQWKSVTGIEGQKSVWLQAWINCYLSPKLATKKSLIPETTQQFSNKNSPLQGKGTARFPCDKLSDGWQLQVDELNFVMDNSTPNNQIQLLNQNIFDYHNQKPTFHYCYLGVKLMKELYQKGLFADSIVVSLDYEIEGIVPIEIIELKTKSKIQNRLLVYVFSEF